MKKLIMRLLGIERLDKIMIPIEFIEHPPRKSKMDWRRMWYRSFGYFAVPIIIDNKNCLIDGYTSYLIAKGNNKKYVKVTRV